MTMNIANNSNIDTLLFEEQVDQAIYASTSWENWKNYMGSDNFYPRFDGKFIMNIRDKTIRDFKRGANENYLLNRLAAKIYEEGERQYVEENIFELPPPPPEILLVQP